MENINWYPGHMKKTKELIRASLRSVDVVIEVIDARVPISSRNPVLEELARNKPVIIALNKCDLSDAKKNDAWVKYFKSSGERVVKINANRGEGIKHMLSELSKIESEKKKKSGLKRPLRMMIVGVPNVGKSSLINRMTGKKSTQVGNRPGVTKGKQWLTLKNGMQLLDTPGILQPKFEDQKVGIHLAFCGSIKDEILDIATLGMELIGVLQERYKEELMSRYKLESTGTGALATMEMIAKKRGFIMRGGRIDYERTANTVLDEFRAGKIGRITLEDPEDM